MNKSVLVTGAGNGLGLETALYLAGQGFEVYASMRDMSQWPDVERKAKSQHVQLKPLALDITGAASIEQAVQSIMEQSGHIYGLVNNAGIGLRGFFEDLAPDEIEQVFAVNVYGTMAVTRAVLPHMRKAGQGRILIVTSIGGLIGSLGVSAYCATKFAQEGFGESLAQEVAPFGIYVSLIEPAIIKTERWSVNRGLAQHAAHPESPYRAAFLASEHLANRLVETSPTKPIDVARSINKALQAKRPKLRYLVGRRAGLVWILRRYLPGELFERLYFGQVVHQVAKASQQFIE